MELYRASGLTNDETKLRASIDALHTNQLPILSLIVGWEPIIGLSRGCPWALQK
jgi:hypothetical protein